MNDKLKVKGVLFDKDGTLIEFSKLWFSIAEDIFNEIQKTLNIDQQVISRLKQYSGVKANAFEKESLIQFKSSSELSELWCDFLLDMDSRLKEKHEGKREQLIGQIFEIIDTVSQSSKYKATTMPNANRVLNQLKSRGLVLGIATSDTKGSMTKSLGDCNMLHYFSYLGCDDGQTPPKPNIHMGKAFMKTTGLSREEFCVVGDSVSDYDFAKALDVKFVGMNSHYSNLRTIKDSFIIIESLDELMEIIHD